MPELTFEMYLDKETKGALRYKDESGVHSFYLRKDEVEGKPEKIELEVRYGEG